MCLIDYTEKFFCSDVDTTGEIGTSQECFQRHGCLNFVSLGVNKIHNLTFICRLINVFYYPNIIKKMQVFFYFFYRSPSRGRKMSYRDGDRDRERRRDDRDREDRRYR